MRGHGYSAKVMQFVRKLVDWMVLIEYDDSFRVTDVEVVKGFGVLVAGVEYVYHEHGKELKVGSLISGEEVRSFIHGFIEKLEEKSKEMPVFDLSEMGKAVKYNEYIVVDLFGVSPRKFEIYALTCYYDRGEIEELVGFRKVGFGGSYGSGSYGSRLLKI